MNIQKYKSIMNEKNINQIELSKITNIPIDTLRCIFSGRTKNPRIDTIQAIENALGINQNNNVIIPENLKNVQVAFSNGVNLEGLTKKDINAVQQLADILREKNENE